ncbi:nicotinate-nucleotide adenylyltransferase [Allorhodopirellula solitaria]|uniref:Probable nicotinate-nucleotide adenylyltransferase n=1 Tax=Allorhodopirellula solitaria TaxID=2527987 RepID=A0A5C5XQU2_9BACT|nr:nicotinate-nucleotide adenylyltransferase [Allorhodopirellula solitaria]TWT65274.1 Nicotinate-nucleotide adenylyltransferase [Allorhodopirellula solitaria]
MTRPETMSQALGIFGGSFDPIHLGHLWIAEAAYEQLPIDQVRWVPAATSPLKPFGPVASNSQRLTMLRLAVSGQSGHRIETYELDRDGVSYTVDTLAYLRDQFPDHTLFFIIGADSLASFAQWKDPDRLLQMCTLAVVRRGGMPPPSYDILQDFASPEKVQACREAEIVMPQIEISSRELRRRVARSQSIRFHVPHSVEAFIRNENLYRQD